MIEQLRYLLEAEDSKITFILSLIAISMIIDFGSGIIAAYANKEVTSKKGINGILRKATSLVVLIFLIPVSVLIPSPAGTSVLWTLYLGYLLMELQSILENLAKMGEEVDLIKKFLEIFNKNND
jgi:toxin secretion/phage lysis holin